MTIFTQHTDAQDDADLALDDDRDGEHFRRHIYAPGDEAMITVAEVKRLRQVEVVALELAAEIENIWDGGRLKTRREYAAQLARARAVGLLPEQTK